MSATTVHVPAVQRLLEATRHLSAAQMGAMSQQAKRITDSPALSCAWSGASSAAHQAITDAGLEQDWEAATLEVAALLGEAAVREDMTGADLNPVVVALGDALAAALAGDLIERHQSDALNYAAGEFLR